MNPILEAMRGGLVVSCQPVDDGPMDRPDVVAMMAQAAVAGGAKAIRIEGVANLRAARTAVSVPIIGIVKADVPETEPRITLCFEDIEGLVDAGADIVAFDATDRPRQVDRGDILARIQDLGALAMADCASFEDAKWAAEGGAAILGTTLSGYTAGTRSRSSAPDLALVRAFGGLGRFIMAEGRYDTPELAALAIANGADAVTVGSVLTRLEVVTGRFATAIVHAHEPDLNGFAIDLGGTKTAVARIENGQIAGYCEERTDGAASPEAQISQIGDLLRGIGYEPGQPVAAAVTGRVDAQGRWHAVNRQTLTQVDAIPLADRMSERLGPATVLNDAAAATLAEHRLGAGKGIENFAFITVSTGVGGGLILNGSLVSSPNGMAGHIGFTAARMGAEHCGSGRMGTVESIASGGAIGRAALRFDPSVTDARVVFERARTGEGWAVNLVDQSAAAIADLVSDLVATVGIDRVAIGGSIGLSEGYIANVRAHVSQRPTLFQCDVVPATLGKNAPLFGAVLGRT